MNRLFITHICIFLTVLILSALEGCGGGGGAAGPPAGSSAIAKVVVSPSKLVVEKEKSQAFTANAFDSFGNPVSSSFTWSLSYSTGLTTSGSINSAGLYQAPISLPDDNFVTVQAVSNIDSTKSGSVSFFLSTGVNVTFSAPRDVTSVINLQGSPLGLKMASSKGKVYLTWVASAVAGGTTLWYSVGDKSGFFSSPFDILLELKNQNIIPYSSPNNQNPSNPYNPSITTDGTHIFIAWDDNITGNYQVYLVRGPNESICGSSPCFAPFSVSSTGISILADGGTTARQQNPSLSIGPQGNLEMVWENVVSLQRVIRYKELDALGNTVRIADAPSTSNNVNYQYFPRVLSDLSGNVSVTWVDFGVSIVGSILYSSMSSGQTSFYNTYVSMNSYPLTASDSYSLSMNTTGIPYLAWSISGGTSATGIWTTNYSSGPPSFSSPNLFWPKGLESSLRIDFLNRSNMSWYDPQTQSVNFMKGDLAFKATSSYQTSGANPVMDIDEGGRVNLVFTTSIGQNFSTWFTRGE